jgi:hypothetical protein
MAGMDRDALLAQIRLITVIEDTNVTDAEIVLLINSAIDEIGIADYWPWLEASTTLSLVADTQTIALPADFEFAIALVDDDHDRTVPYIAPSLFFFHYGNDTGNTGTQFSFFTIWEDVIYLTPTPSAADTNRLSLYYYKTPTQLSTGATLPEFHEAFHQMIVEYVKWKLFDREEYFDQSERAFITYTRYLSQMSSWYARRTKRMPAIAGDGIFRPESGDPNLPWINQV